MLVCFRPASSLRYTSMMSLLVNLHRRMRQLKHAARQRLQHGAGAPRHRSGQSKAASASASGPGSLSARGDRDKDKDRDRDSKDKDKRERSSSVVLSARRTLANDGVYVVLSPGRAHMPSIPGQPSFVRFLFLCKNIYIFFIN